MPDLRPSSENLHAEGNCSTLSLQEHFLKNHGLWWSGERPCANTPACGYVSIFFFDGNGISFERYVSAATEPFILSLTGS
jgi:hypothetical protein